MAGLSLHPLKSAFQVANISRAEMQVANIAAISRM